VSTYDVEAKAWQVASKVSESHQRKGAFLRAYRRELQADPVKFDVATMIILIQIAIQIWKWAKDNGFLSIPASRPASGGPVFKKFGTPMGQTHGAYLAALVDVLNLDEDDDDA
jgi:hypothetical protein